LAVELPLQPVEFRNTGSAEHASVGRVRAKERILSDSGLEKKQSRHNTNKRTRTSNDPGVIHRAHLRWGDRREGTLFVLPAKSKFFGYLMKGRRERKS